MEYLSLGIRMIILPYLPHNVLPVAPSVVAPVGQATHTGGSDPEAAIV